MKNINNNDSDIGWNFDNSFSELPDILMQFTNPTPVNNPNLELFNSELANDLNLRFNLSDKEYLSSLFSGNIIPNGSKCLAQAYSGHQFGYFTNLGDGRAILLGEHINNKNKRFDIQLKGSGKTNYSRNGDGRASLGSMCREYLISEAMYKLRIPTTRSLSVVSSGEEIIREKKLKSAILTRVASSHIRIGTFQYCSMLNNIDTLKKLVNYTLKRHYFDSSKDKNPAITLLKGLIIKQISLVVNWMRVGFVHGVLNTDNVALSGETIDYGPCAFMDYYDPNTFFSSIDIQGRYSFSNQEIICHWNLSRFAETLIPLLDKDQNKSIEIGKEIINSFQEKFKIKWLSMMKKKFGFINDMQDDLKIINQFLNWMHLNKADYTNTFNHLIDDNFTNDEIYKRDSFIDIKKSWKERIKQNHIDKIHIKIMKFNNPTIIPRNHIVEESLNDLIENNDFNKFRNLIEIIKKPYESKIDNDFYKMPASLKFTSNYKTFCGT